MKFRYMYILLFQLCAFFSVIHAAENIYSFHKYDTPIVIAVNSFDSEEEALKKLNFLQQNNITTGYINKRRHKVRKKWNTFYTLTIGSFTSREAAKSELTRLKKIKILDNHSYVASDSTTFVIIEGRGLSGQELLEKVFPGHDKNDDRWNFNAEFFIKQEERSRLNQVYICPPETEEIAGHQVRSIYFINSGFVAPLDAKAGDEMVLAVIRCPEGIPLLEDASRHWTGFPVYPFDYRI